MQKETINKYSDRALYCAVTILSVIIFCVIYGIKIIDPTYVDWTLAGGDLQQHYLGWVGFRNSRWFFPIGLMDTLTYPSVTSIIFTDSIPLFAVFFKILSPILPDKFQYLGLWGVTSFALQGILATRIMKQYSRNNLAAASAGIIFVLTPAVFQRMFAHTALAGQWLILLSLLPLLSSESYSGKKLTRTAVLMAFLSATIHIYYLLINGIILVGICVRETIETRRLKTGVRLLFTYLVVAVVVVALLGGFSVSGEFSDGGLGGYSMNLNALVNPQGFSRILLSQPLYGTGQYEGFVYIGAGFLLICVLAAFLALEHLTFVKRNHCPGISKVVAVLATALISVAVAASPIVTFGDNVLISLPFPDLIIRVWSIFRASGRIGWVIMYLIMLCGCLILSRFLDWKKALAVFLCAFSLQVFDLYDFLQLTNSRFDQKAEYQSGLYDNPVLRAIADSEKISHVFLCGDDYGNSYDSTIFSIGEWALHNEKTMNNFLVARKSSSLIAENTERALKDPNESNVFIFPAALKAKCLAYDLNYYFADSFVVGYSEELDGLTPLSAKDLCDMPDISQDIIPADRNNALN